MAWVRDRVCKLQKRCTRLAAASGRVCQLLAHGRWFFPGTPASSTTTTGRNDIAEILLKVALKTPKSNQYQIKYKIRYVDQIKMKSWRYFSHIHRVITIIYTDDCEDSYLLQQTFI
jgi:hypothetical protein